MKLPHRRQFLHLAAGAVALPAVSRMASAQTYPSRPISIVVPFPAGGATDVVTRVLAKGLSDRLGQSVVVDNRPGANGAIGSASVARARPDGHTLVMGGVNTHAMNDSLLKPRPYDSAKDFAPITLTAIIPIAFAVNPKLPVATLQELVTLANFASGAAIKSSISESPFKSSRLASGQLPSGEETIAGDRSRTSDGFYRGRAARRLGGGDASQPSCTNRLLRHC